MTGKCNNFNQNRGGDNPLSRQDKGFGGIAWEKLLRYYDTKALSGNRKVGRHYYADRKHNPHFTHVTHAKRAAFTLAEMMVVMLILSIVLAAFAPMMTKRRTVDNSSPWRYATNNSDAYYGLAAEQTAMIGQNAKRSDDLSSKLLINTSGSGQAHMALVSSGTKLGQLYMNGTSLILGGSTSKVITPGSYNTLLGYEAAGVGDTTGDGNTGVGYRALYKNRGGSNNTAIGSSALNANNSGNNNTAIGNQVLSHNVSGSNNTAIGNKTLFYNSGSYNVALGEETLYSNNAGSNNVAIGYHVLHSNNSGGYNTAIGYQALLDNTTGTHNVALGYQALLDNTIGNYNIASGYWALRGNTTGNNNIALGFYSLLQNATGSNNIAIGEQALAFNESGSNNIAIGVQTLKSTNTGSGSSNVAIGNGALSGNDTGNYNTAIGPSALNSNSSGENNTASGYKALVLNREGNNNTASGYMALNNNTSGENNTGSGYRALVSNGTGSNNTAFGYKACAEVTGSNKTCIGANSGPVHSSSIAKNDAEAVYLGTSSATVYIPGNLVVSGTFTAPQTSDRRLKNIKGETKSGLAQVRELKVYDYTFKKDKEHKPHVGVIAQDLEKIFPNAVIKGDDGYLKIRRDDMFYAMVNAIKELDAIVQNLVEDIKTAISRLDKHDEEIQQLQKENKELRERLEKLEKLLY